MSDPGDDVPDLSLSANVSATLFNTPLLTDRQIGLSWSDIRNLQSGSLEVSPCNADASQLCSAAQDLLQFVQLNSADIVSGINLLADSLQTATGNDLLAAKIPLVNKSLGELLNSNTPPLAIPDAAHPERSIADISEVVTADDDSLFTVSFNELDPESAAGINVGGFGSDLRRWAGALAVGEVARRRPLD